MGDKQVLREDFPILSQRVHGKPLVYLDNAATMQMPRPVMDRMQAFYCAENGNIHRGIHALSESSTEAYENVRGTVCRFLGTGQPGEILFTSGTTASINLTAGMLSGSLRPGDEILITQMEHHSNYIVWQELAGRLSLTLRIVQVRPDGRLDMERFFEMVNERTRIAAFTELSNVTGIGTSAGEMVRFLRENSDARILIDGAQGVAHDRKDIAVLRPDFYCFSGHKLGAPTGTGVLYVRRDVLDTLRPVWFGGGTVRSLTENGPELYDGPSAFEPGTPNYAGIIGMGTALEYWMDRGACREREQALLGQLEAGLRDMDGVTVLGEAGDSEPRRGCISVVFDGIHSYDMCRFLDQYGVAARSGHLCAVPYLRALGQEHAVRFSVAPYNMADEIAYTLETCREICRVLRRDTGSQKQ